MKRSSDLMDWVFAAGWYTFIGAAIIGWICNLMAIAHSEYITGTVVVRIIGVFMWPLGCVMGWF